MVYPGNMNVNVTVAVDGNIIDTKCSDIDTSATTSCNAYVTENGNYNITLTLSNDVGKAEPMTMTFDGEFNSDIFVRNLFFHLCQFPPPAIAMKYLLWASV